MGMGIYAKNAVGYMDMGEIGMIQSRSKLERAERRNRTVSERKVHTKRTGRKTRQIFDVDDYGTDYEY